MLNASVLSLVWHSQIMLQTWLDRAHGFDDQLLYLVHHFIALSLAVVIFLFDIIQNGSKRTLMPGVSIIQALVKNKLTFIPAINSVISEMHVHVAHVLFCWLLIRVCGKSRQPFFKEINPQRIN